MERICADLATVGTGMRGTPGDIRRETRWFHDTVSDIRRQGGRGFNALEICRPEGKAKPRVNTRGKPIIRNTEKEV